MMENILVGKTINSLKIAEDKKAILFVTDKGEIIARCDADCCSHTWIEHIELPFKGFPALVISAEDIDMPDLTPESDGEMKYYGFKVSTDKGEIIVDYRNESNGYYGGNLSWPNEGYFDGGVYGQNVSNEKWQEVTS